MPATATPSTATTPGAIDKVPKDRATEAAWKTYRDAHAGATPANAVDAGQETKVGATSIDDLVAR